MRDNSSGTTADGYVVGEDTVQGEGVVDYSVIESFMRWNVGFTGSGKAMVEVGASIHSWLLTGMYCHSYGFEMGSPGYAILPGGANYPFIHHGYWGSVSNFV